MKKRFRAFYTLLLAVAGCLSGLLQPLYAQDNVIDEVLWVIGGDVILKSEVEEMRKNILANGERIDGDPYCIIPERIAVQKLFLNQAELDSITVADDMVYSYADSRINEFINSIGSKEKLEEFFGKPMHQIREEVINSTREQYLVQNMQQKLFEDLKLSPADVRRYYNSLPKDSLPFITEQVEVQIISVEPNVPLEEVESIKSRLRDYADRINKGETEFATLARLYSEDEGSSRYGGEIGFLGKASLDPAYAEVAFSLTDTKKASKIVKSEFGYHIIQLIERRGDRINTRHILIKPRVDSKEQEESLKRLDSLRTDILAEKISFEEAARYVSHDKESRNNNGLMVNAKAKYDLGFSSKFQMGELPQDIARQIATLTVGEISKPFIFKDERSGKQSVAIIRLRKRYPGHKANTTEDFALLRSMAEAREKEEIIQDWIREKQRRTYVRIKEGWQNCEFRYKGWVLQ